MFALVHDGSIARYPYTLTDFMRENPQVSLPDVPSETMLAHHGLVRVTETPHPDYNQDTQRVELGDPVQDGDTITQTWCVVDFTAEELATMAEQKAEQVRQQRADAYRQESDPLFFKAQRGEISMADWLAKVAEIKARFSD